MKTLIEIFDEQQTDNVIAALSLKPEKVVYIGFKEIMTKERKDALEKFFKDKETDISLEFEIVSRFDIKTIKERLLSVISRSDGPYLDLTGGKELIIAVAGELSEETGIPMIQFDVKSGKIIPVKNAEKLPLCENPDIKIKDIITLNGGTLIPDKPWVMDADFCRDISVAWEICAENCGLWNRQATVFGNFEKYGKTDSFSRVSANAGELKRMRKDSLVDEGMIEKLKEKKLIYGYEKDGENISFFYKNDSVRRLITKSGNALELYGYMAIKEIMAENKEFADDCDVGVFVDWDGLESGGAETRNELDIVVVKDFVPAFISCKNGEIYKEALYELDSLARRFGGEYAKKIMFASYVSSYPDKKEYIKKRASDMGITLIDGIHEMTKREFKERLKSIL